MTMDRLVCCSVVDVIGVCAGVLVVCLFVDVCLLACMNV